MATVTISTTKEHDIDVLTITPTNRAAGRLTLNLCCPNCWSGAEDLNCDPNDLGRISCFNCESTFSPQEARDIIAEQLRPWDAFLELIQRAAPEG